jgi:hypothetical protein
MMICWEISPPDEDPMLVIQLNPIAPFDFFGHGQVGPGPVEENANNIAIAP